MRTSWSITTVLARVVQRGASPGATLIFAVNFPWFGAPDYWAGQVVLLRDQIEARREEPLVA